MKMITSSSLNLSNVNSTDLFSTSTSISTSTTTTTNLKDNQEKGIEKEKEKINLNPHLVSMINETWDALESPIFKFALEDCLDVTFRTFCNQMYTQCVLKYTSKVVAMRLYEICFKSLSFVLYS